MKARFCDIVPLGVNFMTSITLHRHWRTFVASLVLATATVSMQATLSSAAPRPKFDQDMPAQVAVKSPMMGQFVGAEKPTTGAARIVEEGGHRYLELDAAFSTSDQGPDLHVLLDMTAQPPQSYDAKTSHRYLNLGKLEKFGGAQRYPLPDSINAANYKSVVIWCRMANATFGYAALR
jgi:hypothetical protein